MSTTHKERIEMINGWVRDYLEDGDAEAAEKLVAQFEPFLLSTSARWNRIYAGVHPWDHILQEARIIFYDLLNEYTIGGTAYFNVYIQRKLPLRLRYFFVKEIRRRTRDLSHSDEQMQMDNLLNDTDNNVTEALDTMIIGEEASGIIEILSDPEVLNDRERDMIVRNIINNESHESIAQIYDLSRSRVSRIIKNGLKKMKEHLVPYKPEEGI